MTEYDIGYFEGIRAAFMAWNTLVGLTDTEHIKSYLQWLADELEDARVIRDGHP